MCVCVRVCVEWLRASRLMMLGEAGTRRNAVDARVPLRDSRSEKWTHGSLDQEREKDTLSTRCLSGGLRVRLPQKLPAFFRRCVWYLYEGSRGTCYTTNVWEGRSGIKIEAGNECKSWGATAARGRAQRRRRP